MGYTPPWIDLRKGTNLWNLYSPSSTAGDDLYIYPNSTDANTYIRILGNGDIGLYVNGGNYIAMYDTGTIFMGITKSGADSILKSYVNNSDLYLQTTGTGVIKFGTYTAGAATDSTGYISIKDAAGNTRKLMVQA